MRALQVGSSGLTVVASVVAVTLSWREAWFGHMEACFSAFAVVGTLAATVAVAIGRPRTRVVLASALLLGAPALRVAEILGVEFPFLAWDRGAVATLTAGTVIATVVGLWRRRVWARWLALGGAMSGLGGSVLNGAATLSAPGLLTWGHACAAAGCGAIALLLSGAPMREAFEGEADEAGLWRSPDPVVRALRWALVTALVSAPMLVVYAIVQPVVPGTREIAGGLAVLQMIATVLCVRRKLVGAVLLALSGTALLGFTLLCAMATHAQASIDPWILSYYAVFWVPAGVVSVVTGAVLLRPVVALLRR